MANSATPKADRFTSETAKATGKAERTIRQAAARGAALGDDLERIAGTSLDKGDDPAAMNMLDMAMGSRQGQRSDLLDNIQEVAKPAPTGTSAAAGLRRLRNAASKGNAQAAGAS